MRTVMHGFLPCRIRGIVVAFVIGLHGSLHRASELGAGVNGNGSFGAVGHQQSLPHLFDGGGGVEQSFLGSGTAESI